LRIEIVKIAAVFVGALAKRVVVEFGVPVSVRKRKCPHAYLTRTRAISASRNHLNFVKNCYDDHVSFRHSVTQKERHSSRVSALLRQARVPPRRLVITLHRINLGESGVPRVESRVQLYGL